MAISAAEIKLVLEEHETNYVQRGDGKWDWSCACGATQQFHDREFAVGMTRAHWADKIMEIVKVDSVIPAPKTTRGWMGARSQFDTED